MSSEVIGWFGVTAEIRWEENCSARWWKHTSGCLHTSPVGCPVCVCGNIAVGFLPSGQPEYWEQKTSPGERWVCALMLLSLWGPTWVFGAFLLSFKFIVQISFRISGYFLGGRGAEYMSVRVNSHFCDLFSLQTFLFIAVFPLCVGLNCNNVKTVSCISISMFML